MTVKTINSVQDLLVLLAEDNAGYRGSVWYRGHGEFDWGLTPGYYRLANPPPESTLIKRFKQSAAMLIEKSPKNSFDWLFLMQHYGVPTRLLDWTESPLAALYFAVADHDSHTGEDAALWSMRPSELNKNAGINDVAEEFFVPSFEDDELQNYSVEILKQNARTKLKPLASIATRNNPRIQAQLGVFTIHHNDRISIDQVGDFSHVIKYRIPEANKKQIADQLTILGFTKFQLFPELSSIGDLIKGELS